MRFARPIARLQTLCLTLLTVLLNPACVYRFANRDRQLSVQPRTLYVSPVGDSSAKAGQAAKLMSALRRRLTQDRAFIITDLQTARWGLEVQITDSLRSITRVEKCTQGNEVLASGAVPCSQVSASGRLPDISAEEEVALLTIEARAIDLHTGAVLFQTKLTDLSSGAYNIVGDGTVRASMSGAADLHVLRSMENRDNAIEAIANSAAARIYDQLISIPPPSPSL
ncbi:MAG: hypothetical protein RL189_891 [Pseudomonadota bacterium]|jgi:hypothetical protein